MLRRKKVTENLANMQEKANRSKYDTIEIKGGVLEQERIERRNKKIADRTEKRTKFINRSF